MSILKLNVKRAPQRSHDLYGTNLTWSNGVLDTSAFSVSFHIENDQPPTVSTTSGKKGDRATVVIGPAWASDCQFGRGATNFPESPSFTNLEEVNRTSPCSVPQKKSFLVIFNKQMIGPKLRLIHVIRKN